MPQFGGISGSSVPLQQITPSVAQNGVVIKKVREAFNLSGPGNW